MPNKKTASTRRRTQLKPLSKRIKKLGPEELKKIKGGTPQVSDIPFKHPVDKSSP